MKIKEYLRQIREEHRRQASIRELPLNCQQCELLGICRDEENDWECIQGCMLIENEEDKYL